MNSSDQSLYKLDSVFHRRWKKPYSPINTGDNNINIRIDKNTTVKWKDFLENINEKIAKECEDRRIGPNFVKCNRDSEISAVDFVGKVLDYLYRAVFNLTSTILIVILVIKISAMIVFIMLAYQCLKTISLILPN